jgi:hypothetical protein
VTLQELTHENKILKVNIEAQERIIMTLGRQCNEYGKELGILQCEKSYMATQGYVVTTSIDNEPQDRKVKALEKELARNMKLWDEVYEAQLGKIGSLQKEQDRIKTELLTLQFETEKKERAYQHCITGLKLRLMEKENIPWGMV